MITKSKLIDSFDELPENLTMDQVIDHIVFIGKVEKGMEDSQNGKINTKDEARQKLGKWLK